MAKPVGKLTKVVDLSSKKPVGKLKKVADLPIKQVQGPPGPMGPMPKHRWRGTSLQFERAPNEWGTLVDLQGPTGQILSRSIGGGGSSATGGASVNFLVVDTASYTISADSLDKGINIVRVRNVPTTIYLPRQVDPEKLIYINDETGNAGTDNITIQVAT